MAPTPDLAPWEPLTPHEVARVFAPWDPPWWIAGGYAIELAAGEPLRRHGDIDVGLLRRDQRAVHALLAGWELWAADPPGHLRPWPSHERLPAAVHDIWCRPADGGPWRLQLMLEQSCGEDWVSRRDRRIRRPIRDVVRRTAGGIPHLAPEVQLFYKAKAPRAKDDLDLAAMLPRLDAAQARWLRGAIETCYGPANPWLPRLPNCRFGRFPL